MRVHNHVKARLQNGLESLGFWLSLPSPAIAEIMSGVGMDWVLIDTEHGVADYDMVEQMIRAMKGSSVAPIVRVPANEAWLIKKALDRGAAGIIVPLVNTAEEAANAVAAAKYPPEGIRGVAGTRASLYGADLKSYFSEWNNEVLVAVQVETRQAVENVEEIAAVPGVDIVFCGPGDLSANLGIFQQFDHPMFIQAVDKIVKAAQAHGKAAGYMAFEPATALARIAEGFQFVCASSDARLVSSGAKEALAAVQEGLEKR